MQKMKWLFLLFLISTACSKKEAPKADIQFDRTKWDLKTDRSYPYRGQMINDLLGKYKWAGMKKAAVVQLLGEPDAVEEDIFMLYHYNQKFLGAFVLSTQSLVVELAPDSTVVLARTN